jgi:anti-anti-sigma regulatory factor
MQITISQEEGRVPVTVFEVQGDIDVSSYEELQAKADEAHQAGMRNLLLDLTQVKYVGSTGLQAFHHIFNMPRDVTPEDDQAMRQGLRDGSYKSAHLKLLNPSRDVANVLTISGFDMFLEIHTNRKKAIASF